MRVSNRATPFSIAGFILGEAYMLFAVLAPYRTGAPIPADTLIGKLIVFAIFFGPFGALVGLGVGLLVSGMIPRK